MSTEPMPQPTAAPSRTHCRTPLVTLALLLALPAVAPGQPVQRLDSGLRVAVITERALPLVSVQLWFHTGASIDHPARTGRCRAVMHMLAQRDAPDEAVHAFGVREELRVLPGATVLHLVGPAAAVERLIELQTRRLRPLDVNPAMITAALDSTRDGWAGEPWEAPPPEFAHLQRRLWGDHPHGRAFAPPAAGLAELPLDAWQEFADRWLIAGNATLVVVGDVDTAAVGAVVERACEGLAWRPVATAPVAEPPATEQLAPLRVEGDRKQVLVAWLLPRTGLAEAAAAQVLMERVCNPADGLLAGRVDAELAWRRDTYADAEVLTLAVTPAGDLDAEGTLGALDDCLAEASRENARPVELLRARALVRGRLFAGRARFDERALERGLALVVGGDLRAYDVRAERIERVNVSAVRDAARRLAQARRAVVIVDAPVDRTADSRDAHGADESALWSRLGYGCPAFAAADGGRAIVGQADAEHEVPAAGRLATTAVGLDDHLELVLCRVPPIGAACVLMTKPRGAERRDPQRPRVERLRRGPWTEYLTLHGLRLRPVADGAGVMVSGPHGELPQMIELALRATEGDPATTQPTALRRRLIVVGDIDVDRARELVRRVRPHAAGDASVTHGHVSVDTGTQSAEALARRLAAE